MKNLNYLLLGFLSVSLAFTSCSNNDDDNDNTYTIPDTYSFVDSDGNSTVSFSGQTQRKDMLGDTTYRKLEIMVMLLMLNN